MTLNNPRKNLQRNNKNDEFDLLYLVQKCNEVLKETRIESDNTINIESITKTIQSKVGRACVAGSFHR